MSGPAHEVVVVGGGPAGSALATFLAERGRRVLLLDSARFPRDKICGEGISPAAWPLLDAMGASAAVLGLQPWRLRGMRLVAPDGTPFRGEYRGRDRCGFAVRRLALDAVLLAAARGRGVDVHEGTRVTGLLREGGIVSGVAAELNGEPRSFSARLVCGADGRRSVVARRLGLLVEHRTLRRFAVRGYWDGTAGLEEWGEMHIGRGGYCGIAPLSPTRANVTFVVDAVEMKAAAGDLEVFYRDSLRVRWPALAERLQQARLEERPRAIGPLALQCRAAAAPGVLLLGDAAGFYDPFTGEGVTLALRTAALAAEAVDAALAAEPGERPLPRLREYEGARDLVTRDKFRFNRIVQRAVGIPVVANAMAHRLARRPELADRLVGIAGDFVSARSAFGLRFLTDLLRA